MQLTERLVETEGSPGVCDVCEERFSLFQLVRCRLKPALLNLDGSEANFGSSAVRSNKLFVTWMLLPPHR